MNIDDFVQVQHTMKPAEAWDECLSDIPMMAENCIKCKRAVRDACGAAGVEFKPGSLRLLGHYDNNLHNLNAFLFAMHHDVPAERITLNSVIAVDVFTRHLQEIFSGFEKKLHDQEVTIKNLQEVLATLSDGKSK